jgi:hypothetical protein
MIGAFFYFSKSQKGRVTVKFIQTKSCPAEIWEMEVMLQAFFYEMYV